MKQYRFEHAHQNSWDNFEQQLNYLEKKSKARKKLQKIAVKDFPQHYQTLCQHLALAEQRSYSPFLIERLQRLVQRGHQLLYKRRTHFGQAISTFILRDFPRTIRQEKTLVIAAHLIFYLAALITGIINYYAPDFIYFFMSPADVKGLELMYADNALTTGITTRDADQNWLMFAHYIYNNISIAFRTFASGLIFCIGTLFYLIFNALNFGIVAAHLSSQGLGHNFWPFVIGHGAFELTAILIAAAAGFKIGLAVLIPHRKTRAESLRHAAKTAIKLVFGVFLFLVIAAFIEAYWSSMREMQGIRYVVGTCLWLMVFYYFTFMGRGFESHEH